MSLLPITRKNQILQRETTTTGDSNVAVTALATSHGRGSVIAGCSDGQIRVLDIRLREIAKLKSHMGGVVDLALSDDGNLLATAGYGSRGSSSHPLYNFPDPNVYCYDLRYLGRGGIPHSFAGLNGGPRHLSFLPPMDGVEQNRLLATSGQVGGGMQIILPFQENASCDAGNFVVPQLDHGESITAVHVHDLVCLGTSNGKILQYRIADYKSKKASHSADAVSGVFVPPSVSSAKTSTQLGGTEKSRSSLTPKEAIQPPSFDPPIAELALDPKILLKVSGERRSGMNDSTKSIFSSYTLGRSPTLTTFKESGDLRFGPLASSAMVGSSRSDVLESFMARSTHSVDFVQSVPASELKLDLLKDHRPEWVKSQITMTKEPLTNPNKFLYHSNLYTHVYKDSFNRFKKRGRRIRRDGQNGKDDTCLLDIPTRYRLSLRPTHKSAAAFSHAEHNDTNLVPGW
jgi:WD40 repeat protein